MVFVLAAIAIGSALLWYFGSNEDIGNIYLLHFGVIFLVVAFAIYIGIKRLGSAKRGEPTEDEMSKKVMLKTASLSYYISLYLWVIMIFVKDRVKMDTEEILGTGILGMAVCFACCWLYFNFRGVKSE